MRPFSSVDPGPQLRTPQATIRVMMENRPCTLTPHRLFSVICVIVLLDFVSGGAQAQMGVATGGGVAVPAQPLPAGVKAPVIDYRDIAAEAGLSNVNTSGSE